MKEDEQNIATEEEVSQEDAPFVSLTSCGVGWRIAALAIDGAVCTLVFATILSFGVLLFGDMVLDEIMQEIARSQQGSVESLEQLGTSGAIATVVISVLYALLLVFYGTFFECSSFAATPGKLVMGLKVCTLDGHRLYFSDAFARNLYKHLLTVGTGVMTAAYVPLSQSSPLLGGVVLLCSALVLIALMIYAIVDPLYAVFSITNQTLHDRWAYTLVVKEKSVNRWARLLVGIIAIIILGVVQSIVSGLLLSKAGESAFTKLQNAGLMELEESNVEVIESLPPETNQADLSVQDRISLALAKAKKEAEDRAREIEESSTPAPTPTPKKKEKKKDFTPEVDGAAVLNRKNKFGAIKPKATPVVERQTGAVQIGKRKFKVGDVFAALSSNRRVILLNFYEDQLSPTREVYLRNNFRQALEDPNVTLRFKLIFSKYGDDCSDTSLQKYIIDVNVKKAGIPYKKDFYSFDRGGNQIISKEYLSFECLRQKKGFVTAELRGSTSFLLSGRRIPVIWNSEIAAKFGASSK